MTKKEAIESMLTSWKSIATTELCKNRINEQRDFLLGLYSGTKLGMRSQIIKLVFCVSL